MADKRGKQDTDRSCPPSRSTKKRRLELEPERSVHKGANAVLEGATRQSGTGNRKPSVKTGLPDSSQRAAVITFDLETTDLIRETVYPHITQLAAYSQTDQQTFNRYIFPKKPIEIEASQLTGLTLQGRQLFLHGQEVNTVPLQDALKDFCSWLERYKNITLLAHNGKWFDFPIVLSALQSVDLCSRFIQCVARCVDTLPFFQEVFPGRGSYKQVHLVRGLLGCSYGAHDAVEDVKALGKLVMLAREKSPQAMARFSFSPASVLQ